MVKPNHPMAGQAVGTMECPECGKPVTLKPNKNGIVYFYCAWPDNETGERCNHQCRFSRAKSNRLIDAKNKPTKPKTEKPDDAPQNFLGA